MAAELEPLQRLEDLFRQACEKEGARLVYFGLRPSSREVYVMLDLDDDLFLDERGKQTKDEFEEIERNFHVQRKDEKTVEAVTGLADLEKRLAEDDGIL